MGTYTTEAIVSGRLKGRVFDANSKPTATELAKYITGIEALVNEILRTRGYSTVPLEDADQIAAIEPIITAGVASMAEKSTAGGRIEIYENLWKEFQDGLDLIRRGEIITKDTGDYLEHPKEIHSFVEDNNIEDKITDDDDFPITHDMEF